jgi:proteic killer suppression protein
MEIFFEQKYLEELFYTGKTSDKKHRFQPQVVRKYIKVINLMESLKRIEDLFPYASLNYEVLQGDKAGLESVRVNQQYRIEFCSKVSEKDQQITICNILELSNHYK